MGAMIHSSVARLVALTIGILVAAGPVTSGVATGAATGPRQGESAGSPPVFRIDDELIPVDRYGEWISKVMGPAEAYNYALIHLVDREAERLGVTISDEEVLDEVQDEIQVRIDNAFQGQRSGWIAELERVGRSEGEYLRARSVELRPWLLATRLTDIDREIPERKIVRDWELHYGAGGRRYELRMLLLRVVQPMPPKGTPAAERNLEREQRKQVRLNEAQALRKRALAGEDLGELARRYSDDRVTRENAGRLPQGFTHFGWPTEFIQALAKLNPGDLSEPLYAKGGWWLVEVMEIDTTPLESVRAELVADLERRGPESDEVAAVQQRLLKDVEIEILPGLFEPRKEGEFPDAYEPVLRVGDNVVRRGEYALWLMHTHGSSYATRYIEDQLVERRAREMGVVVTDEDVRRRVREHLDYRVENAYRGSREAFNAYLEASGLTEKEYTQRFAWRARSDLLVERLIRLERTISDEQLRLAWEDAYGKNGVGQEVRSLSIAVQLPELEPGLDAEAFERILAEGAEVARKQAAKVVGKIEGGEDFEGLAERYGADVVPNGIEATPHRFRPGTWPEDVAETVSALQPGDVSEPIRFGAQWLVFECLRRPTVPFEQVRDELETELINARPASIQVATYRNVLLKKADVEVLPALYE